MEWNGFVIRYVTVTLVLVVEGDECTSQFYLCLRRDCHVGICVADNFQHLRSVHRLHLLTLLGLAETDFHHLCNVLLLHIGEVQQLNTGHLLVVEPIGSIQLTDFVQQLGVQLLIVNVASIVNQLSLGNAEADVATTARCIGQWMRIVGSRYE